MVRHRADHNVAVRYRPDRFFGIRPITTGMLPQLQSAIIFATSVSPVVSKQYDGSFVITSLIFIAFISPFFT
jgi:hypothetical protein